MPLLFAPRMMGPRVGEPEGFRYSTKNRASHGSAAPEGRTGALEGGDGGGGDGGGGGVDDAIAVVVGAVVVLVEGVGGVGGVCVVVVI